MGKVIKRKGHWRKQNGKRVWVEPTTYVKKVKIPISNKKKDRLGISFDMPIDKRRKILRKKAKKDGERAVAGKLRAIQVLNKNRNPKVSKKAAKDAKYIYGSFKGKKYVGKGKGFSK